MHNSHHFNLKYLRERKYIKWIKRFGDNLVIDKKKKKKTDQFFVINVELYVPNLCCLFVEKCNKKGGINLEKFWTSKLPCAHKYLFTLYSTKLGLYNTFIG